MADSGASELILVDSPVVACDGGDGPLGHPRVFLNIGDAHEIECPYCSLRYALKPGAERAGH
jgi:uncharacterized Zn-finger protein